MPIRTVNDLPYYLICFDAKAAERTDDSDGLISQRVLDELGSEPITDVFLMSHGWLGDIPAAISQYDRWIAAMAGNTADIDRMTQKRPGFRPLLIGLHWPSKPYGDEELGGGPASFSVPTPLESSPVDDLVEEYSQRLVTTTSAREALKTIFTVASENVAASALPDEVIAAYQTLDREIALGSDGVGAEPGSDREPFDPRHAFDAVGNEVVSFGGPVRNAILAPLQTLSFWKMKDRAAKFGAGGAFEFLRKLQTEAGSNVRFHLMGHSFGCVVMSALLAGPPTNGALVRPIDSVALLQGALSLWAYTDDIPHDPGQPGYFHRIFSENRLAGPLITTQSEHDTAVCTMYPLGAGAARQVSFSPGELPKYGAIGEFGIRGLDALTVDMAILPADGTYDFDAGKIYNLESSQIICKMEYLTSGAHSDLAHPEVAHAIWEAAMSNL